MAAQVEVKLCCGKTVMTWMPKLLTRLQDEWARYHQLMNVPRWYSQARCL